MGRDGEDRKGGRDEEGKGMDINIPPQNQWSFILPESPLML